MKESIRDGFAAVGSVFTVVGALASVAAVLPAGWLGGAFVEQLRVDIASAIAPAGYVVLAAPAKRVAKNSAFSLHDGDGILLAKTNGSDTISASRSGGGTQTIVSMNGKARLMSTGDTAEGTDSGCLIFFASIDKRVNPYEYSFVYKCQ